MARPSGGVTGGFSLSSLVEYGDDDDEELDSLRNGTRDGALHCFCDFAHPSHL